MRAALLILILLTSIAYAQRFDGDLDIGRILFVDILGMGDLYPNGAPFTGKIINDLVMVFLIPSAFLIFISYTVAGRLTDNTKIDLMLSILFYLFVVFGGLFKVFALLSGPTFLILIFIMGLIAFYLGLIGIGKRGGGARLGGAGGQGMPAGAVASSMSTGEANTIVMLLKGARTYNEQKTILTNGINKIRTEYSEARKEHNDRLAQSLQQQASYLEGLRHLLAQAKRYDPTPGPVREGY